MPRPMWKGAIAFGLVNIPVELHTAVRENRPRFRMLHARDESPVRYERVCQEDGKPVAWEDLVKGYEYEKGRFVVITKDDFKTAALEKTRTIDILDFVDPEDIDDRYFETPYYLTPGKGSERAYALLREAIRKSGRVGIAKVILRDSQHLAAVEAIGDALVLTMMRFGDELVDISEFTFPRNADLRGKELEMATALIENLSADWAPDKYTDEYRDNLMRVIHAKLKGRRPKLKEEARPQEAEVIDLMERLQKSLAQGRSGQGSSRQGKSKKEKGKKKVA